MRSVMEHAFSMVPSADIPRSSFDRSHGHKTTFNAGYLVPVFVDEALPGDTFNLKMTAFARLATPIFPIMDNMFMDSFFFFVPYRLVWANFVRMMGERSPDPGSSIDYTVPLLGAAFPAVGSVFDYMGLRPGVQINTVDDISCLPFRAYNLIYNEWFRDENLQDAAVVSTADAASAVGDFPLRRRGKRHDYFTSCLPWPQKGDSVELPLGTSADIHTAVSSNANIGVYSDAVGAFRLLDSDAANVDVSTGSTGAQTGKLYADLSAATAATINQLRQAFQVQKLLERDARGGTRYTELVRSHFGVISPDARLQRPEYLGGGSSPVIINQVPQTSATDAAVSPQGNLAAYGTVTAHNHGFSKSFTEHGIIIGLVNVRADLTYQQGVERFWFRQSRYDFYWPALAMIGEQAVLNREIYYQGDDATNDWNVFGYQERYAEYRYKPSRLSGLMRSDAAGTLDAWHLAQDFSALPVLGDTFIQDTPPVDRVVAVAGEPHFIFDSYFSMRCARPMPMFGVPGLIDHF